MADPRVAIIDDEQDFLMLMQTILSEQSYEVGVCSDGTTAFDFIQEWKPSLVFLDIRMSGVSGFDILRRLKTDPSTSNIKVIVTSAATDDMAAAADDLRRWECETLAKPFDIEEVLRKTRSCLGVSL
jgi:CheY-like chemotaxis protein